MDYRSALDLACEAVVGLRDHTVDVIDIKRPRNSQGAVELAKIVSKLSPIVANLLEYTIIEYLNTSRSWPEGCRWVRQDPGFPDAVLSGMKAPRPGVEIKAWFPLATEITARFRDSQLAFQQNNVRVALVCWVPEYIIAGRPKILDVWVGDAIDVARARDDHYHSPPEYVVLEPGDTADRTVNLQQTNCNGLRFQGDATQLAEARALVRSWGPAGRTYSMDRDYQNQLRLLTGQFPYRLDTNFAKMDRIVLASLEEFKARMAQERLFGQTIQEWISAVGRADPQALATLVNPSRSQPLE